MIRKWTTRFQNFKTSHTFFLERAPLNGIRKGEAEMQYHCKRIMIFRSKVQRNVFILITKEKYRGHSIVFCVTIVLIVLTVILIESFFYFSSWHCRSMAM